MPGTDDNMQRSAWRALTSAVEFAMYAGLWVEQIETIVRSAMLAGVDEF